MSAIMAAAYEDRVEILTDGAVYSDDGTVMDLQEKIWRSESLPLAVAMRGGDHISRALSAFIHVACCTSSVDKTITTIAQGLASLEAKIAASGKEAQGAVDGVIAAVSETEGPVLFYFITYTGAESPGVAPFTLVPVPEASLGSTVPPRDLKATGLPLCWAVDGLREFGPRFMDAMRQHPMTHVTHPDKPLIYGIGGHVDLTVVDAEGARTERVHTWPDRVGEKIQPARLAEAA